MENLSVIDSFMTAFTTYIDAGFGLLGGDVKFLVTTLIGIDITLAGLFWTYGEGDVLTRLLRKVLYVGAFAFILNSFSTLTDIIFRSFANAGVTAGGGSITAADLLKPGSVASTGFSAAWPLLEQVSKLMGFTTFFDNFLTIAVLIFAWAIVIVAFFILAVQMFVTIIEFKLTSLAGFILVPFALWNRTSFLAERVLGNVVSSGVKVMVLAVVIGIGSTFFADFTSALKDHEPDIGQAMSLVLASLSLFGLGIFAPGIASGLVAGAPQLGAGAALGTAVGAAGMTLVGAGAARGLTTGALGAIRSGTALGSGASAAYALGQESAGMSTVSAGLSGVARAAGNAATASLSDTLGLSEAVASGRTAAREAFSGAGRSETSSAAQSAADETPPWARTLRAEQSARQHRHAAVQALREGDRGGASATPDISEKED